MQREQEKKTARFSAPLPIARTRLRGAGVGCDAWVFSRFPHPYTPYVVVYATRFRAFIHGESHAGLVHHEQVDLLAISSGGAPAVAAESILDSTTHSTTGANECDSANPTPVLEKIATSNQSRYNFRPIAPFSHQPSLLLTGY